MPQENLLVSTDWLAEHLDDARLRVVDIRGKVLPASEPPPHYFSHRDDYEQAHIPGAVFVDWTTDIVEPGSPSYDIANPERYAALMAGLGIGDDTFVVAYDDAGSMFAARFWWTLNYYGHSAVAVLNGGWQKWIAEGRPTTAQVPSPQRATFTPRVQEPLRVTADDILAGDAALLDMRSTDEFAGKSSRANRKGHIPGAWNMPRKQLLQESGELLPIEELRQKLAQAGFPLDTSHAVTYCNSGVSASFGLLVLRLVGVPGGSVYDGSWKDWANDASKPIE